MNIIIPEDPSVDYFVLDLRDALQGQEMRYDNKPGSLPECVLIFPKKYLNIKKNGSVSIDLLEEYLEEQKKALKYNSDIDFLIAKVENIKNSYCLGQKVITIPKGEASVLVPAPLWKNSVQFIEVVIKNPILELGETEKFIDVQDCGACPADILADIMKEYVPEIDVKQVVKKSYNSHKQSKQSKEYEDEGMQI